ncbi:hypothetical protein FIBSPDRAFT_873044, partial [Athelia psychrophila]
MERSPLPVTAAYVSRLWTSSALSSSACIYSRPSNIALAPAASTPVSPDLTQRYRPLLIKVGGR